LSGGESVDIVRFLMSIKDPSREVVDSIESAVKWFEQSELKGVKWIKKADATQPNGFDCVVVKDPKSSVWARFYEIGTNRPIFAGRDGVLKYDVAQIEHERRTGYEWYVDAPEKLLKNDYPAWKKRHVVTTRVH
jgi:PelA/Pel-15E family pectate lyase